MRHATDPKTSTPAALLGVLRVPAPLEMVAPPVRHEHYYDRPKATWVVVQQKTGPRSGPPTQENPLRFIPPIDASFSAPGIATAAFIPGSQSVAEVITGASTVDAAAVAKMAIDCTPFMLSDSTSGAKAAYTVDKGTDGPSGLATTSITRTIDFGSTKASETFIIARAKGATAILAYSFGPTDPVTKAVGDATTAAALAKLTAVK